MKKNYNVLVENEIDLRKLIKIFWQNKFLFLIISISCTLVVFLIVINSPKYYKAEIVIKDPPMELFYKYDVFLPKNLQTLHINGRLVDNSYFSIFNNEFNKNLLSTDNLENFINQNGRYDNFKALLKSKNISPSDYFYNKNFGNSNIKSEKNKSGFFVILNNEKEADDFLLEYINFSKNITIANLKKEIVNHLLYKIYIYEENLNLAKSINLEKSLMIIPNQDESSFLNGTMILSLQIKFYKKKLKELENESFHYDLTSAEKKSKLFSKRPIFLDFLVGLVFGFILFTIIIFSKNILKKN